MRGSRFAAPGVGGGGDPPVARRPVSDGGAILALGWAAAARSAPVPLGWPGVAGPGDRPLGAWRPSLGCRGAEATAPPPSWPGFSATCSAELEPDVSVGTCVPAPPD